MGVRGKFYVAKVELFPGQTGGAVTLNAVTRGARNASWSAATPSGEIRMHISNPAAHKWFMDLLQKSNTPEVFVDFGEAPKADPGDGHRYAPPEDVTEPTDYRYNKCADCGLGKDDELTEPAGTKTHPNG